MFSFGIASPFQTISLPKDLKCMELHATICFLFLVQFSLKLEGRLPLKDFVIFLPRFIFHF